MSGWVEEVQERQHKLSEWIEIEAENLVRLRDQQGLSVIETGPDYLVLEDGTTVTIENVDDYSCPDEADYRMAADFHRAMQKDD